MTAWRPPTALTIAGSDSGGGAGIQADLKTFSALGVFGTTALTALTAQNTLGVQTVIPVGAEAVGQQITSVLDDIPVDATKIGMLASADVVAAVISAIEARPEQFGRIVLDPVMIATSGDALLEDESTTLLRERLLPLAHVLTPNLPEAARLLDEGEAESVEQMQDQAMRLRDLGTDVVMLKGGHRAGEEMVDVIAHGDGVDLLRGERVRTRSTHGTGCTLSSAIAGQYARIARARALREAGQDGELTLLTRTTDAAAAYLERPGVGEDLLALRSGRDYLQRALISGAEQELSRTPHEGHGPVDHLVTLDRVAREG
ncbi:bifunctional hydroxymethylpyrimidine kinase/phosphomethylpyrimidine kinase [Brachybacterium alimentarium]|uniref:bifunctional hydroxymethylpyrimidine kinase/phosphomethylpyrimidine kinase n=1 Tax=Brachybacterium alimentarium TaxID=47845 RepID=UPI003FD13D4C